MRYAETIHPSYFRCKKSGKQLPVGGKTQERKEKEIKQGKKDRKRKEEEMKEQQDTPCLNGPSTLRQTELQMCLQTIEGNAS